MQGFPVGPPGPPCKKRKSPKSTEGTHDFNSFCWQISRVKSVRLFLHGVQKTSKIHSQSLFFSLKKKSPSGEFFFSAAIGNLLDLTFFLWCQICSEICFEICIQIYSQICSQICFEICFKILEFRCRFEGRY